MLSHIRSLPDSQGSVKRSPPHCRTCGKPMKGHKMALCQLRSPSEEVSRSRFSLAHSNDSDSSFISGSPPPPTPWTSPSVEVPRNLSLQAGRLSMPLAGQPQYPYNPISVEPSWELPPDGGFLHRRNPYIPSPFGMVERDRTPLRRTDSWESTEKAESEYGGIESRSTLTISLNPSVSLGSRHSSPFSSVRSGSSPPTPPYTPLDSPNAELELGAVPAVEVLDTAGNKIHGLDISTIGDHLRAILRQAKRMGLHATVVRPHIGYQHNSVHIRTNQDADQHTTVFVSPAPSRRVGSPNEEVTMVNMMCNGRAGPRLAGVNEATTTTTRQTSLRSRMPEVDVKSWVFVFSAMFAASLFAGWVNSQLFFFL